MCCASLSDLNRMDTLMFPIDDIITIPTTVERSSSTTAVSPGWFRRSTKCINDGIACLCQTHRPNAATATPKPMKASMCTRVNRSDCGVRHVYSKARSLAWSWVAIYIHINTYKCDFFTLRHFFLFRPRLFPRDLGSVAHREPARTQCASLGPGRGPWHVIWGLKVSSLLWKAFRARRAIQAHANPHVPDTLLPGF